MSEERISLIWEKAKPISGASPDLWRVDENGRLIYRYHYGKTIQYGWEIDHDIPKSRGGSDSIYNLFPMQWKENRSKSDKTGEEYCNNEFLKAYRECLKNKMINF